MEARVWNYLNEELQKHKFVFYDEASGEIWCSNDRAILKNVTAANRDGFNFQNVDTLWLIKNN